MLVDDKSRAIYSALQEDLRVPKASCLEVTSEACSALERSIFKKFEDLSSVSADNAAFEKFASVNEQCRTFKLPDMHEWEWMCYGEIKSLLYHFFKPTSVGHILDWNVVFSHARPGPGASIGARGEDFYTKHFDSTLTYTHKSRFLVPLYQRAIRNSSWWKQAEILRQSIYGFQEVAGSSMSTVPKNRDISRTTCTEPSLNMFFQLGVGEAMSARLREWGLDIPSQAAKNSQLARVGSVEQTFGTIDLSSASDSLSLKMMASVLPQDIFCVLWNLRCDVTSIRGNPVELHMLSTMGNGYTFPLQTVLFTCVVLAVYRVLGIRAVKTVDGSSDNWGVYGDDIIVRREAYSMVCRMLNILGFAVNGDKSFNEGPFRESCGTDWYSGVDIRGVYCKTMRTVGARFSLINRLLNWSSRHGVSLFRTIRVLLETVPVCKVPFLESDDAGVKVPSDCVGGQGPFPTAYQKYVVVNERLRFDTRSGRLKVPRGSKLRRRLTNDCGLVTSMLQGSFAGGTISLRVNSQRAVYRKRGETVLYWDSITRVQWQSLPRQYLRLLPVVSPDEWQRWSSVVSQHLEKVRE